MPWIHIIGLEVILFSFFWVCLLTLGEARICLKKTRQLGSLSLAKGQNRVEPFEVANFQPLNLRAPLKGTLPLTNYLNVQFYGNVTIGQQALEMVFDTGSADTWVKAKEYEPTENSVKSAHEFTINYAMGGVSGILHYDRMSLDADTSLVLPRQGFLVVEPQNAEPAFDGLTFDGVMGLGFPSLAITQQDAILRELRTPFSFFLTDHPDYESQLMFGEVPSDLYFEASRTTLTVGLGESYWSVPLYVNIGEMVSLNRPVLLDTGTSFVVIPQHDFLRVINAVFPAGLLSDCFLENQEILLCPCSHQHHLATLHLVLGGRDFYMTGSDLIYAQVEGLETYCYVELQTAPGIDLWILGDSFLSTVVSTFDPVRRTIVLADAVTHGLREETPFKGAPTSWVTRLALGSLLLCLLVEALSFLTRKYLSSRDDTEDVYARLS